MLLSAILPAWSSVSFHSSWNLSFLLGVKKHSYNYSLFSDAGERYWTTLFAPTLFFRLTFSAGTKKVLTNSRHSRVTSLLNSGIGWKKCYWTTLTTAFGPDWTYLILCFHSAGGIQFQNSNVCSQKLLKQLIASIIGFRSFFPTFALNLDSPLGIPTCTDSRGE